MENLKYHREDYDISKLDPHWADFQIVEIIGENKDVLEICCATGYIGKYLKGKRDCKVWGVEMNAQAAEIARSYYQKVVVGDAANESLYDSFSEKFDVILCSNVLEHLTDPLKTLLRLKKLLKSNIKTLPANGSHFRLIAQCLIARRYKSLYRQP